MTLRRMLISTLLIGLIAFPVLVSAKRLAAAKAALGAADADAVVLQADMVRLLQLRGGREQVAARKPPEQDVIARVSGILAESGIPSSRFGGLRPEADAALAGARTRSADVQYRRQSVLVTLNELNTAETGEFLSRWCATQSLWTPTRVELIHNRGSRESAGRDPASNQNDGRYTVTILLTATYIADREAAS